MAACRAYHATLEIGVSSIRRSAAGHGGGDGDVCRRGTDERQIIRWTDENKKMRDRRPPSTDMQNTK